MTRRPLIVTMAVAGLSAALAVGTPRASATALGLTSQVLDAWTFAGGSGAPAVLVWDGFTRPDGTNLNNQPTPGDGPRWRTVAGTWTTADDAVRNTAAVPNAAVVVDCGLRDVTTTVVVSGGSSFSAGVALKRVGANYLYVAYHGQFGGWLELGTVVGANRTVLGLAAFVGTDLPATLSAAYDAGVVTVRLNGVTEITSTLPASTVNMLGASTQYGLYSRRDTQTTFDDFRCEA